MNATRLSRQQDPLKQLYREQPDQAVLEMHALGEVDFESLTCRLLSADSPSGEPVAGLHPKAGGEGRTQCSGDLLLQSLVACSGVTLAAVATSMGLRIQSAQVEALGTMDFRGTLAVDRSVPIGLTSVIVTISLQSDEDDDRLNKLIQLTERYCVVLQTLKSGVSVTCCRG